MQFVILNFIFISKVRFPAVMAFERPLSAVIIVVRLSFPKIVNADLPSKQIIFLMIKYLSNRDDEMMKCFYLPSAGTIMLDLEPETNP